MERRVAAVAWHRGPLVFLLRALVHARVGAPLDRIERPLARGGGGEGERDGHAVPSREERAGRAARICKLRGAVRMSESRDYVLVNRAKWDSDAAGYEEAGRRNWNSNTPQWGIWGVPD